MLDFHNNFACIKYLFAQCGQPRKRLALADISQWKYERTISGTDDKQTHK